MVRSARAVIFTSCIVLCSVSLACAGGKRAGTKPGLIYATGEAALARSSEQPNRARAYLQAKELAKIQAIVNLAESARGTIIKCISKADDNCTKTYIERQVKGVLRNIKVASLSKRSEGKDIIIAVMVCAPTPDTLEVVSTAPKPSPAPPDENRLVAKKVAAPASDVPSWLPGKVCAASRATSEGYTSVVLDASGTGAVRCMSPKILREAGGEVWGTQRVDYDFLSDYGIVAYTRNLAEAYASRRAGANPLVLRALSRGTSGSRGDIVISDADARILTDADRDSKFLSDFRVIVVLDNDAPKSANTGIASAPAEERTYRIYSSRAQ